jgi:hypothetical protein
MAGIVIRLNPQQLANPDADLRYRIPEMLEELSQGMIVDDGYTYDDDSDEMHVYLLTTRLDLALPLVLEFLRTAHPLGNDLSGNGVAVGTSAYDPADTLEFHIVHPAGITGTIPYLG